MRARLSSLATFASLLVVASGLGIAGGFVYAHEPQPEVVNVRVNSNRIPPPDEILRGTIATVGADAIEVTTVVGPAQVPLDAAVAIEELVLVEEEEGAVAVGLGAPANVGGTRADSGYVLSGVVIIESTATP